jgi:hypothetical protein
VSRHYTLVMKLKAEGEVLQIPQMW